MSGKNPSNTTAERVKFNRMVQGDNEATVSFIARLCDQAGYCEYKEWKDEHIRDRLLAGLQDKPQSEMLQFFPDLTLHQAKTVALKYDEADTQNNPIGERRAEAGIHGAGHGGQGTTRQRIEQVTNKLQL